MRITSRHNLSSLQPARGILGVCKSTVGSWQNSILHPAVTYKECTKTLREQSSLLFLVCIHSNSVCSACMRPPMAIGMSFIVHTLFAHASSSQDVSCSTLMISLISALIFSKVKLRFFKASSTPWLPDVFVVTKILIPESQNKTHSVFALFKKKKQIIRIKKMWLPEMRMGSSSLTVFMELTNITRCSWCVSSCCRSSIIFAIFVIPGHRRHKTRGRKELYTVTLSV